MTDLLIYETGNGGDLKLRGADLVSVNGYENVTYLAMFGGASWWGNYMQPSRPFQSQTETVLETTALNSAGRLAVEEAVKNDLAFLTEIPGTTFTVSVTLVSKDRIDIDIAVDGQTFYYSWNPDKLFLTYRIG